MLQYPGDRSFRERERIVCKDSLQYRCPGRKVSNTPFFENATIAAPESESSDNSSNDNDEYGFVNISSSTSLVTEGTFYAKVGMSYFDTDDDNFTSSTVCAEKIDRIAACRLLNYFLKYHESDTPDVFEYTPFMEVMNSCWCRWQLPPSAAARAQRLALRPKPSSRLMMVRPCDPSW